MLRERNGLKLTFLFSMLLVNIVVILFLSLFNYITFYDMGKSSYKDKFVSYNSEIILGEFKNIDDNLAGIMFMADLYFADITLNEDVLYPQMNYIGDKPERVSAVVSSLQKIRQSNPMIFSLDVYYENTSTAITGFSNLHFFDSADDLQRYLPWFATFGNSDAGFIPLGENSYPQHHKVLTYVKRFSSPKWKDSFIYVAVHIDPYFSKYLDEQKMRNFYIISPVDGELYSIHAGDGADAVRLRGYFIGPDGIATEGTKQIEIGNEKFLIQRYVSQQTGLEYYYTFNFSLFDSQYYTENKQLLFSFILSVVINTVFLGVLCFFNYRMFKERLLRFSKTAGLNIDRRTSLDNYLDSATKEIISLNKSVKSAENLKIQQKIRSAILDGKKDYQIAEYFKSCRVCCIIMENPDQGVVSALDGIQADADSLGIFDVLKSRIFITSIGKTIVALVIFDTEGQRDGNVDFILSRFAGCRIDIGETFLVSEGGIPRAYDSAQEIGRYRFLYEEDVLSAWNLHIRDRGIGGSMLKTFNQIEKDISFGLPEEFEVHFGNLIGYLETGNFSIDFCQSTLNHLVSIIYRIMLESQVDAWGLVGYDIREYSKKIKKISEYKKWMLEVVELFFEEKKNLSKNIDNDLQQRISDIIENNLENDISLGFVADAVGLRSDALSHMFKQLMGKNYIDYIKEKKMLRAIRYLRRNMAVQEIAERLGYRSAQYFIMVFKKAYGITPFQYKKTVLDNEEEEVVEDEDIDDNL